MCLKIPLNIGSCYKFFFFFIGFYIWVTKQAYGPQAVLVPALLDKVAWLGFYPVKDDAFAVGFHGDVV